MSDVGERWIAGETHTSCVHFVSKNCTAAKGQAIRKAVDKWERTEDETDRLR